MSNDLEAAFAEAETEIKEAELAMLQRHQVSSPTLNDSGCDLTANAPLDDDKTQSSTLDEVALTKRFSADSVSKISSVHFRSKNGPADGSLSPHRSRQRPRTTPASQQHISKLPSTGHVSSIIGRFEQSRSDNNFSAPAISNKTSTR